MQSQAQGPLVKRGQTWRSAARKGIECTAQGTGQFQRNAPKSLQSCELHTYSGRSFLNHQNLSGTKGGHGFWRCRADLFQRRVTRLAFERLDGGAGKLGRRVAAAVQPRGDGTAADDVTGPNDGSGLKESVEEVHGEASWVRRKWAGNRAEYERLRGVLKDLGLAGFLSYGLFNTGYYLVAFLSVWFFVSPSPGRLGMGPAAKRFVKIFAVVWASSQVTKLLRAGGALLLAPLVDRGLDWFTAKGRFRSKAQAFWAVVGSCIALALVVFVVIVSLWA